MRFITFILLLLPGFLFPPAGLWGEQLPDEMYTQRFAFIVGSNNGGPGRVKLLFAVNDARAFRKVLEDMGGVQPENTLFLAEPNREIFAAEMKVLAERVAQAREIFRRVEVIFYYSGHSDEENLLLDGERVSYRELRRAVTMIDADVRIAILDSCASGAFTQTKGVTRRSPFLIDTAYNMKGNAFMTSSSASEAAQESSRLKGSFFTHYLVAGMRGAADMNQDGRITLNEAYQFAFDQTLEQTERTVNGPQHPSYNIQMSGTGDVVVTEIWKSEAVLVLKRNISDKIYIHNRQKVLVMKLEKPAARDIAIGLAAGVYRIINISGSRVWGTSVTLVNGKRYELDKSQFEKIDKIPTRARGNSEPPLEEYLRKKYRKRFQLEIFGGFAALKPGDLNLRATFDENFYQFYHHDYFTYKRNTGEITFYTSTNEGGTQRIIKDATPLGLRLRYNLNDWLAFSVGFSYFSREENSWIKNKYTVIEASGLTYIYSVSYSPYTLMARGATPQVGIHLSKNLSRSLRAEALVTGGPILASCKFAVNFEAVPVSDMEIVLDDSELWGETLEEKGSGVGLALYAGTRVNLDLSRTLGLFWEVGYNHQKVGNIKGPGHAIATDRNETWHGKWGIKANEVHREWGSVYWTWPSNYWRENNSLYKIRDFTLDLSGFQARVGVYYRF
jgi:hypothetical protein